MIHVVHLTLVTEGIEGSLGTEEGDWETNEGRREDTEQRKRGKVQEAEEMEGVTPGEGDRVRGKRKKRNAWQAHKRIEQAHAESAY